MFIASHYTRDIQRFATSHYLYTGVRITVGVMIPTLALAYWDLLTAAISFVWGALFVSLADQPGPIHHRRNGLLTSTVLNAATLLVTGLCQSVPALLWIEIGALSFLFSLAGIYGNRASSIGVLALVVMVLNVTPADHTYTIWINTALMTAGGLWYTGLSLMAYRVRPYLLVQQAMGEYLNALADYVKAKSDFYDAAKVDEDHYNRLMLEQVDVQQVQQQVRDLLFKTREFVTDAAPKGRSLMLMFIESVDLYEQTMSSYEDYKQLHRTLKGTGTMERMHQLIVDMGDYMELVALAVQAGRPAADNLAVKTGVKQLQEHFDRLPRENFDADAYQAVVRIINNIKSIADRMHRLGIYSHFETTKALPGSREASLSRFVTKQPIELSLLLENFTLQSNHFRHAVRLCIAMLVGYGISLVLPTSNSYWVMLTIATILRPVYSLTQKRNRDRVIGTVLGATASFILLYFVHANLPLLVIMIFCMVMAYSLLRLHYKGFVFFLTIYVIIIFHFLNPVDFSTVIIARLIDTVVGSVLATLAARFILPTWEYRQINDYMAAMIQALHAYYSRASEILLNETVSWESYRLSRRSANVALANLSEAFQRMLSENGNDEIGKLVHQFVVSSHTLTGYIAALGSSKDEELPREWIMELKMATLQCLDLDLTRGTDKDPGDLEAHPSRFLASQLRYIFTLSRDTRKIIDKMTSEP